MLQVLDGLHPPLELHPPLKHVPKRLDPTVGQGTVPRQEVLKIPSGWPTTDRARPASEIRAKLYTVAPNSKSIQRER